MAFSLQLDKFEGPLHLLLELIEREQLDISEIALAKVTDGYLQYLQEHPEIPMEELADFLVIASRLLLIKSRLLLPFLSGPDEEAAGQDLESQLRIYKEYLEASKTITDLIGKRRFLYVHEKLPHVEIGFAPPEKLNAKQMADIYRAVLQRLDFIVRVPTAVVEKTVSIHEKIIQIQSFLRNVERASFRELLMNAETKIEIVVSFLALLELIKQRSVCVSQGDLFGDIDISTTDSTTPVC